MKVFSAKFEQEKEVATVLINYTICDKEYSQAIEDKNPIVALRKMVPIAFQFLKIAIDELSSEVEKIKPHFFDNSKIPYLPAEHGFTKTYWLYLELRARLLKLSDNPYRYAEAAFLMEMPGLVPFWNFDNKEIIKERMQTIKETSATILRTIKYLEKR